MVRSGLHYLPLGEAELQVFSADVTSTPSGRRCILVSGCWNMAEGGQGRHLAHLLFAGFRRATTARRFTIYPSWPYLYPIQKQSIPHLHLRARRRDSYLDANSSTVILSDLKLDIGLY